MAQAVQLSVPAFVPDPTSNVAVAGYEVQGSSTSAASGIPTSWADIPGSPFTSNLNILDTSSDAAITKLYRVKPVLQVTAPDTTVYTLDAPWSRAFSALDTLYDASFTAQLIPILRSTYLADSGTPQTNGTKMLEATGPGQGVWVPDGTTNRFSLQYVENDDPVRVLDGWYKLAWTRGGVAQSAVPDQDYHVDLANGVVEFATAPATGDYLRFEFRKCDFLNDDLYQGLASGLASLSQYGINGYQLNQSNNLLTLNKPLVNPDLADLVCKIAVRNLRDGLTEAAIRHDAGWRDGSNQYDPQPNRNLQFAVQKLDLSDGLIRKLANGWIRSNTVPIARGDFDVMFDMSSLSPISIGMFQQFAAFSGYGIGFGIGTGFWNPWFI